MGTWAGKRQRPCASMDNARMTRKRILLVLVLLVVFGALYYFYGGHSTLKGQPPIASFSSGDLRL
jgi:hypothetical protein